MITHGKYLLRGRQERVFNTEDEMLLVAEMVMIMENKLV